MFCSPWRWPFSWTLLVLGQLLYVWLRIENSHSIKVTKGLIWDMTVTKLTPWSSVQLWSLSEEITFNRRCKMVHVTQFPYGDRREFKTFSPLPSGRNPGLSKPLWLVESATFSGAWGQKRQLPEYKICRNGSSEEQLFVSFSRCHTGWRDIRFDGIQSIFPSLEVCVWQCHGSSLEPSLIYGRYTFLNPLITNSITSVPRC